MYHRRIICLSLVLLVLALPLYSFAASSVVDLSRLTSSQLLQLYSDLQAELEKRGLSVSGAVSKEDTKSASIIGSLADLAEPMVWVPKSGEKYHSKSTCSNMKNPRQVKLSEAKACGFTACKRCKPPK